MELEVAVNYSSKGGVGEARIVVAINWQWRWLEVEGEMEKAKIREVGEIDMKRVNLSLSIDSTYYYYISDSKN